MSPRASTRRLGVCQDTLAVVAVGLVLHVALEQTMLLSTFSLQMSLYLLLFLPWFEQRAFDSRWSKTARLRPDAVSCLGSTRYN